MSPIKVYPAAIPDGICNLLTAKYKNDSTELFHYLDIEDDFSYIIRSVSDMCVEDYCKINNLPLNELQYINYTATYYPNGTGRPLHFDGGQNKDGAIVSPVGLAACMNKDFSGGTLVFPEQDVQISLAQGDLVIFPCNFCFPHYVEKVNGFRVAIYPTYEYRG